MIRLLPEGVVNRIAAGEVVERPASVVKELVENAIDAGATRVEIEIDAGGLGLVAVGDDGAGMAAEALPLAVLRHATSKLPGDDLVRIAHLGFRGEALASIGAVARLTITSRRAGTPFAATLTVDSGVVGSVAPCAGPPGTRIEVRELFRRTPARLKFMRSQRAEAEACLETVRRLALARPGVAFLVRQDGRAALDLPAAGDLLDDAAPTRMAAILGQAFIANAVVIEAGRDGITLRGAVSLPTHARGDARAQYLVVNGRPVQDRALKGALRAAYTDLLFHDRQPLAALSLELRPEAVDVNVHPTKAEVRFRDPSAVRGLLIGAIRRALAEHGHRAAVGRGGWVADRPGAPTGAAPGASRGLAEAAIAFQAPPAGLPFGDPGTAAGRFLPNSTPLDAAAAAAGPVGTAPPLGAPVAQVHATYILAETEDGLVIVDQHAAHERIVYERLKDALRDGGVERQALLVPEIVELPQDEAGALLDHAAALESLGLVVEGFGRGAVLVREVPAVLGAASVAALVGDLARDLEELGSTARLERAIDRLIGVMACHGSVRAGSRLSHAQMDALLRAIEQGRHTGQCIHGRPTHVALTKADLERLFERR